MSEAAAPASAGLGERDAVLVAAIPHHPGLETYQFSDLLKSISSLIAERREGPELPRFQKLAAALVGNDTRTLIVRLETMTDPLLLWAAHLALDARDVPPSLRWPGNQDNEQAQFITWCADLFWFCKRQPAHRPLFRGWQGLFKNEPGSPPWHATAHRQFLFVAPRYSLSHWCSKGLDLSQSDRALLMMLPTNKACADRRALEGARFPELERLLLEHAAERPDKARRHPPHEVANRRAAMWRTFVLCARNQTVATAQWVNVTGERLTRQAFTKQIAVAREVQRRAARGLVS